MSAPQAAAYQFQSGGVIDMLKKLKDKSRSFASVGFPKISCYCIYVYCYEQCERFVIFSILFVYYYYVLFGHDVHDQTSWCSGH